MNFAFTGILRILTKRASPLDASGVAGFEEREIGGYERLAIEAGTGSTTPRRFPHGELLGFVSARVVKIRL